MAVRSAAGRGSNPCASTWPARACEGWASEATKSPDPRHALGAPFSSC